MNQPPFFWITQKWPLPVEDGARQATYHLVKSLAASGRRVHLLAIVPRGEIAEGTALELAREEARTKFGVERMSVVFREPTRHLRALLTRPWEPLTFAPYLSARLAREVLAIHDAWERDSVVVFDGLHGAGWYFRLPDAERARLRIAHRSHNVESNLWRLGAGQRRFPVSLFLKYQAKLVDDFERRVCRASGFVGAVSANDQQGLRARYGETLNVGVTPIGVPLAAATGEWEDRFPTERKLLFVGRLDWDPNRDGLKWFLEQVWPEAVQRSPDLSLTIVGAGDGSWLQPYLGLPRLRFLGRVPELAPHYRAACAALVPIFFGSGTRVKAIEAGTFARACFSTEIGVEGIGLEPGSSYFRAETRAQWIEALCGFRLEDARARGQAALARVSDGFDPARVAERFAAEVDRSN